jgi:hypothetical protein
METVGTVVTCDTDAHASAGTDRDPDLEPLLVDLYERLRATGELPVEETGTRWLGEAQAVAGDVVGCAPEAAVEKRIVQVDRLLSNVEETADGRLTPEKVFDSDRTTVVRAHDASPKDGRRRLAHRGRR